MGAGKAQPPGRCFLFAERTVDEDGAALDGKKVIPERSSKSYYQHHQGMIDKRSESNISTNETKKAAVLSRMGSRTATCLLILYSFLSLGVRVTPVHKNDRLHL